MIPMSFAKAGKKISIKGIMLGGDMNKKIREMGFSEGNTINVIKNDGASVIVGFNDSRIAINIDMAKKIMVDEI